MGARLSYTGIATYDAMGAYLSYPRLLRTRHFRAHQASLLTKLASSLCGTCRLSICDSAGGTFG